MDLIFIYHGDLDHNIKSIVNTITLFDDKMYMVELSNIVCNSVYKEDYLMIKQILRTLKIGKISKNNVNSNDFLFLDFFINNIDKINLINL